jgi:hypothetical protein
VDRRIPAHGIRRHREAIERLSDDELIACIEGTAPLPDADDDAPRMNRRGSPVGLPVDVDRSATAADHDFGDEQGREVLSFLDGETVGTRRPNCRLLR